MSAFQSVTAYKCNPKIIKNAKINIIVGSVATAALLSMPLIGKPLLPHVGIAVVAVVVGFLNLKFSQTPIADVQDSLLRIKLHLFLPATSIPVESIQAVDEESKHFVIHSSLRDKPLKLSKRMFNPDDLVAAFKLLKGLAE